MIRRAVVRAVLVLSWILLLLLSAACRERGDDPVVIVDPGPPFPPLVRVVGARRLPDGSAVLVLQRVPGAPEGGIGAR